MKWLCFIVLIIAPLYAKSFSPKELYAEIPKGSEPTHEIAPLLSQKYTYLGKGAQTYAFLSEDGKIVLKLFKARHHKKFKLSRFFRSQEHLDQSKNKWHQKFNHTIRCYKLAMLHLKEEAGLIYIHFEKTPIPLPATLIGKKGFEIDLANYPFILQKKALLVREYLQKYPEKKDHAQHSLKELFASRLEKGYSDAKQDLNVNYGFVDDQPIQIDVGKIEPFQGDPSLELEKIHRHIDRWISREFLSKL